jgi:hypothetical protein
MNDSGFHAADFLSSGAGIAVMVLLTILVVTWILFPLIAWSYLAKIHRELGEISEKVAVIRDDTAQIEANTRRPDAV